MTAPARPSPPADPLNLNELIRCRRGPSKDRSVPVHRQPEMVHLRRSATASRWMLGAKSFRAEKDPSTTCFYRRRPSLRHDLVGRDDERARPIELRERDSLLRGTEGAMVDYLTDGRHWPRRAVDYAGRLAHAGRTIFDLYHVDFLAYSTALANERPSISAMLSCFMETHLAQTGKPRWAEKTPGHLKQFVKIRVHFPDSPFVCILRNPRDVALSLMKVPWSASTFYNGLLVWKSYLEYYKRFMMQDARVLLLRFEGNWFKTLRRSASEYAASSARASTLECSIRRCPPPAWAAPWSLIRQTSPILPTPSVRSHGERTSRSRISC